MAANLDELTQLLTSRDWVLDTQARQVEQADADANGMSAAYPYNVLGVYKKGDVVIVVEQNTSSEEAGGLTSIIEHPAVARIQGPKGHATVSIDDRDAVLSTAEIVA